MLQSNQKRLLSMLQLDSNQGEELQNDNADNTSEISSDNSKEDEVLLPEESKRAVVSATPKMKEVVIPVYIKRKPRRRNLPSVFTRYAFLNYMNDISKRITLCTILSLRTYDFHILESQEFQEEKGGEDCYLRYGSKGSKMM